MINQLVKGIKEKDAPIVVGLDPMLSYVPEQSGSSIRALLMQLMI